MADELHVVGPLRNATRLRGQTLPQDAAAALEVSYVANTIRNMRLLDQLANATEALNGIGVTCGRGHPPAPARRWQGHCHHEGGEDQDENEAVGIADPLDELKPGLAARPRREPPHTRGI
jgi:hypothetical protein